MGELSIQADEAHNFLRLTAPRRFYRPELDVVRFTAFLMVYLTHTIPVGPASPRWVISLSNATGFGVPVFFALSAYLITELLTIEKNATGAVDVRAFYARRILRIWPLYFLILGIGFSISRIIPNSAIPGSCLAAYLLFVGNWYTSRYGYISIGISPLWSITVEEQFYLLWPLILRYATRRTLAVICSMAWLSSQGAVIYLCKSHTVIEPALWTNTMVHLQYFAVGAGLSLYFNGHVPKTRGRFRILTISTAWLFLFAIAFFLHSKFTDVTASLTNTFPEFLLVGVAITLLLIGFLGYSSFEEFRVLRYLGKISYGLYVYHLPCLLFLGMLVPHLLSHHSSLVVIAGGLPLTVGVASISYRYFESPFLRMKERFEVVRSRVV